MGKFRAPTRAPSHQPDHFKTRGYGHKYTHEKRSTLLIRSTGQLFCPPMRRTLIEIYISASLLISQQVFFINQSDVAPPLSSKPLIDKAIIRSVHVLRRKGNRKHVVNSNAYPLRLNFYIICASRSKMISLITRSFRMYKPLAFLCVWLNHLFLDSRLVAWILAF